MNKLYFDLNTFGITQTSLNYLRNELCKRIEHELAVFQIPTGDITCGFLIVDKKGDCLVWSGDGFRTDGGGEGGAGFRTAKELLRILGIHLFDLVLEDVPEPLRKNGVNNEADLKAIVKYVVDAYKDEVLYDAPAKHNVSYVRI